MNLIERIVDWTWRRIPGEGVIPASIAKPIRENDVAKIDDEIVSFNGTSFARGQAGTKRSRHTTRSTVSIIGVTAPEVASIPRPSMDESDWTHLFTTLPETDLSRPIARNKP